MSIELKPCPWCGAPAERRIGDTGPTNAYRKWVECTVCTCRTSVHLTEDADDRPADDAWNALPRALVWTTDPPRESGAYWHKNCLGIRIINLSRPNIPKIDGWFWAGPIPTPQEPAP